MSQWDKSPRILIIDDNPNIHHDFELILQGKVENSELEASEAFLYGAEVKAADPKPGYRIEHAFCGMEGVEKVKEAIAEGTPYALAFVDIRMPGIDGVETIERIWSFDRHVETVICTAYADYNWDDLAKRLGRTDRLLILKKPFQDIEVMQLASSLVEKWFLARRAALKMEQMELLVAQRTQKFLDLQQREHQRLHELDQTKLRFLINLAQEFRDPLTLILAPLSEWVEEGKVDRLRQELALRQGRSLLQMVDEALALRRFELEEINLEPVDKDLVTFVRGVVTGVAAVAERQKVSLDFRTAEDQRRVRFDSAKLEKVLLAVFSFALESISEHGRIAVSLSFRPASALIRIEDTGRGIAREDLPFIFGVLNDQLDRAGSRIHPRLGMILARELIRVQGGDLEVESPVNKSRDDSPGTQFLISLPIGAEASKAAQPAVAAVTTVLPEAEADGEFPEEESAERASILLVEDNVDLLSYVRQELESLYGVVEARNGEEGLREAVDSVPDLVIADIEMPGMDGLELCRRLKANDVASHIPVILLSSIDPEESHLEAMEAGADDCFSKPFRMPLLLARIENLLQSRRKLHEHFQQVITLEPRDLALNQVDAAFLRQTMDVVEAHLADFQFDVDVLAQKVAVSRRQLFRKFKALVGCPPNVFIRTVRLKRAAQLLKESKMTVSEIIFAVGFSDPKYFRAVFKGQFGMVPAEYAKQFRSS